MDSGRLSLKKLELAKAHHHPQDPELEAINSQMAHLEKVKEVYFKVILASASLAPPVAAVPETDSNLSGQQLGLYASTLAGVGIVARAVLKEYNVAKAYQALQKGNPDDVGVYSYRAGLSGERRQIIAAMKCQQRHFVAACAMGVSVIFTYTFCIQLLNETWVKK